MDVGNTWAVGLSSLVIGLKSTGRLLSQKGDQAATAAESPCDLSSSSFVTFVGEEEWKVDPAIMIVLSSIGVKR